MIRLNAQSASLRFVVRSACLSALVFALMSGPVPPGALRFSIPEGGLFLWCRVGPDVSARDVQLATSQWTLGKSFDTFAPMGPHIVTVDEVMDPHALEIRLSIGGETLQHSNTRELIFGVPELIEYLSQMMTLEPGDIISTGTPAGVGLGRTPPRWLKPGEEVLIEIENVGSLRNPVIAEQERS